MILLHRHSLGWKLNQQLSNLGFLGDAVNPIVVAVVVAGGGFTLALALALVAGERVVALDVAGAARVDPDAALVALDHLFAVVEGDAADAVHGP